MKKTRSKKSRDTVPLSSVADPDPSDQHVFGLDPDPDSPFRSMDLDPYPNLDPYINKQKN